uniref:Uncharacterized protein n=1 Tax=Rhizophora mucronata TaxID=61149 RepID=A0A2P2K741_RHIMU
MLRSVFQPQAFGVGMALCSTHLVDVYYDMLVWCEYHYIVNAG